jgi:hypothetical protein
MLFSQKSQAKKSRCAEYRHSGKNAGLKPPSSYRLKGNGVVFKNF